MKRITVKIAGSGEPIDIQINPGTTTADILSQLNLEDYVLFPLPNLDQFLHLRGSPVIAKTVSMLRAVINFKDEEEVYSQLMDGDRVCAIASSKAAAYIRHIVYGSF